MLEGLEFRDGLEFDKLPTVEAKSFSGILSVSTRVGLWDLSMVFCCTEVKVEDREFDSDFKLSDPPEVVPVNQKQE